MDNIMCSEVNTPRQFYCCNSITYRFIVLMVFNTCVTTLFHRNVIVATYTITLSRRCSRQVIYVISRFRQQKPCLLAEIAIFIFTIWPKCQNNFCFVQNVILCKICEVAVLFITEYLYKKFGWKNETRKNKGRINGQNSPTFNNADLRGLHFYPYYSIISHSQVTYNSSFLHL